MADDQTAASAVLWEQSKSEVAQQDTDVDSLRTRAVALLSVGVGGLFGSRLPHGHLSPLNVAGLVVALGVFAMSGVRQARRIFLLSKQRPAHGWIGLPVRKVAYAAGGPPVCTTLVAAILPPVTVAVPW